MAMESDDLLETLVYLGLIGVLPYVAVEIYELAQRTIARRRRASRH
jgi:hypothetical protein